jgi:aryl carrier-like protein
MSHSSPRGEVQPLLDEVLSVWRELLANDQLTEADDFFRSGGDSLLAARMTALVRRRTGVRVTLRTVFRARTAAALAAAMGASLAPADPQAEPR